MEVLGCIILLAVVTVGIAWFCLERKEKQERREFEGRYFKVIDELNELEDRCIELSKSAVIEELFEGAKEKLDEYVQKIARKK